MTKYIAFLRGIMPGNPNMNNANLRSVFEKLGFQKVQTVIASGNVLFESESEDSVELETKIETAITAELGFTSNTIIRSQAEINQLVNTNPFGDLTESKQEKPNVTFFKVAPDQNKLPAAGRGFEARGFVSNAFCYIVDMTTIKTPEAMVTLEKAFGKGITTRTWNTVMKVHKLLNAE